MSWFNKVVVLFCALFVWGCQSKDLSAPQETQIVLVRHAEKLKGKDPNLSNNGQIRAKALVDLAQRFDIRAILSSQYNRTQQTAHPLASHLNLTINKDFSPVDFKSMLKFIMDKHKGQTVLVVGHSNTVPSFINYILSEKKFSKIDESEFKKLFLVKISKNSKTIKVFNQKISKKGKLELSPAPK